MIGFHGIGILFHGICISFRCISLHFMNFVTFRFMSSKRDFATDGAPYKGPYMSLADLQKKTILSQGRLKMIYEKKILQKCLNTGGILSDTGKVWSTSVQKPTVICSPFSIQRETWS